MAGRGQNNKPSGMLARPTLRVPPAPGGEFCNVPARAIRLTLSRRIKKTALQKDGWRLKTIHYEIARLFNLFAALQPLVGVFLRHFDA